MFVVLYPSGYPSQFFPNPLDIWLWNRTAIHTELEKRGFEGLATLYRSYYRTGWELFDSGMTSYTALRRMVSLGYRVVATSLESVEKLQ